MTMRRVIQGLRRHVAPAGFMAATLMMIAASGRIASAGEVYTFERITSNAPVDTANQYTVEVIGSTESQSANFQYGSSFNANQVLFVFKNTAVVQSSITDVYFQDGTLLEIASVRTSGSDVNFDNPATPAQLPGGNDISPKFLLTAPNVAFSADSDSPISQNGVNQSTDWLGILFTLKTGQTYESVIAALAVGETGFNADGTRKAGIDALRIGMHVQSIGTTGDSDGFVNVNPVPEPSTTAMALTALVPLGYVALRRIRRRR